MHIAEEAGAAARVVDAAVGVNEAQKERMVSKVLDAVGDVSGKTIGQSVINGKHWDTHLRSNLAQIYHLAPLLSHGGEISER